MSLLPAPTRVLSDSEVACVLTRAVGIINPLLDLLASDPVGLKERTRDLTADGAAGKVLDAAAWVLDAADVPGTKAWEEMDVDARVHWWVRRVGAIDTIIVAFPGVLGVIADRLPLQDFLGFANQAVILCAVAREHGVTDRRQQVRLLASVMCDRNVGRDEEVASPAEEESAPIEWSFAGIGRALWQLAGLMRAIGNELVKRQRPKGIYRYLGMLPAAGAVADFLGEFGALNRAAKEGRAWIGAHQAVTA